MESEYVKFATEIGKRIVSAQCKIQSGPSKPGLLRRSADFPSLMLGIGFSPAFTFYISKIEDYNRFKDIYNYLSGGKGNPASICKELDKREGSGYAGYVAIILLVLNNIGKRIRIGDDPKDIYYSLLDVASSVGSKEERLILPYLNEIKKVLEALPYG
ncbi:type III-B CRISPR module-associated protein Cmr5 [Saccharolobus solfataricus]|uniref:CRISPR type III-B/RAMP module-associated protein Cmr5 n=3 Tax=Saccharolobus solfataricus TaxID=2287 RepID=Q97Y37_SACS2|nr:CRISPR-associated protein Cmr5 [Saccharolobus solfataricus]AAK41734.1 Hypothetical protein SSO1513 [Saccharolobus solfataricus P2]AKA74532.1 type III-B CRISPR module-associated protein Cmr5 [Saccharolobus solfataricus]AKA77228.1 type III-B CRISPR module-associated protein Cmr5 [Saccharolobus solfataricus]AKA79920.1 type III-B CRISPR module-associated protein Cmr5 [Saccharolobus solfataricus]AZF69008.1 type III-B CRISPR module-associated protein Cmr5 [Saccharolobus solfataricus]